MAERLDIATEFSAIQARYKSDPRQSTFNALLLGNGGTGKTYSIRTARKPVLLHSFDPGGSKSLRVEVEKGEVTVDSRFETEIRQTPTAYNMWEQEFHRLKNGGVFSQIGTYCVDSLTTFSDAVIYELLKRSGRPGGQLQKQDWGTFLNNMKDVISTILNIPCDVIVTGHLTLSQDEATGKTQAGLLIGGQSKDRLPLLFDELYIATAKEGAKNVEYKFLTANTGYYTARTRIGSGGKFDLYEEPNWKNLLKKAGLSTEDKQCI